MVGLAAPPTCRVRIAPQFVSSLPSCLPFPSNPLPYRQGTLPFESADGSLRKSPPPNACHRYGDLSHLGMTRSQAQSSRLRRIRGSKLHEVSSCHLQSFRVTSIH